MCVDGWGPGPCSAAAGQGRRPCASHFLRPNADAAAASLLLAALIMPFFSAVIGFVGSFCFWPLAIYFPLAM